MKTLTGKKFCRLLEKRGWVLNRIQGSHHIYTKKDNPARISVPVHRNQDLKIGLLKHLMDIAGFDESDL